MTEKPKLAMYWASSCGGCEIALVNIHEKILDVDAAFDFVFCPCLLDTKKKDIEAMPDGTIALTLFNGAIRTDENEEMAKIMRRKSRLLVAFGSCASGGCIPGLSNLSSRADHLRSVYLQNPSTVNPDAVVPQTDSTLPEGVLHIPAFHDRVKTLAQVVDVDYVIPGCPPESHQIINVIEAIIEGKDLPPRGSTLGCGKTTVCDECNRTKKEKSVAGFVRTHQIIPDPEVCLLEQGLVCMGVATRGGCGALCPQVNMPCAGCYGPPEGVTDQGAKMVAALGSILSVGIGLPESEIHRRVDAALDGIPDPAGSFYKFGLSSSLLGGKIS